VSLRNKKNNRTYSAGNLGKWMAVGTELPIMVIAGVYIGYYLGQQFGPPVSTYAPIIGAFLGLLLGTYSMYVIIKTWERRNPIEKKDEATDKEKPSAPPSPPSVESKIPPSEKKTQKKGKGSELSEDEKWDNVLKLLKLQVNFEDDSDSSSKNDAEPEE
jgi:hypothetical protein